MATSKLKIKKRARSINIEGEVALNKRARYSPGADHRHQRLIEDGGPDVVVNVNSSNDGGSGMTIKINGPALLLPLGQGALRYRIVGHTTC